MARYTRSRLGLVPPADKEGEFRHRYRFPTNSTSKDERIRSLFDPHNDADSGHHSFIKPSTDGDVSNLDAKEDNNNKGNYTNDKPGPRDVIHTDPQFKSPLDFEAMHSNERYDLSTKNIVEQLSRHGALKLKYSDFVYCKDYGNYPNNRLIIVRRFGGPVGDNLTRTGSKPIAKVVTWFDDQNPPIAIDFGINWQEAEANFKAVLNNMGNDIGLGKIGISLGDVASGGFGILPFPGAFEPFTRSLLSSLGIISGSSTFIPSGSGTLIKEAKVRKLISDDQTGSSLNGKITVNVKCSWEQKFIGGIDPTPVYYDLLRSILHFGSDDASFYAGGGAGIMSAINKFLAFLNNPFNFIKKILEKFTQVFKKIKDDVVKAVNKFYDDQKIKEDTSKPDFTDPNGNVDQPAKDAYDKTQKDKADAERNKTNSGFDRAKKKLQGLVNLISDAGSLIGKGMANKYRHVLMGIGAALTGAPSTPWHITVGNPFRPILSSGDMYCEGSMKLQLGPTLAFNDLPSSIDLDFTLTSARNLGANEIFRKLTTGEMRFSTPIRANFYHEFNGTEAFTEASPEQLTNLSSPVLQPDGRGNIEEDANDGGLPSEVGQIKNPTNVGGSSNGQPVGSTSSVGSPAGSSGSQGNSALGNASGSSQGTAPAGGNGNSGESINKDANSSSGPIQGGGAGTNQPGTSASNVQDQINKGGSSKAPEPQNPNPYKYLSVVAAGSLTLPEAFPGNLNAENIFANNSLAKGEWKVYYEISTGGGFTPDGKPFPWEPKYGIEIKIGSSRMKTSYDAGSGRDQQRLESAKEQAIQDLIDELDNEFL